MEHTMGKIVERDFAAQMSIALFLPLRNTPAAGLNSSVLDLCRFIAMVFADGWPNDHQVLKPLKLSEMLLLQNSRIPKAREELLAYSGYLLRKKVE